MKCYLFLVYCAAFHIAACLVATGPASVVIKLGWAIPLASVLIIFLTMHSDRAAARFATLGLLTCLGCYTTINIFGLGQYAASFYIPPFLVPIQIWGVRASLKSVNTHLQRYDIASEKVQFGPLHFFTATMAFAASLFVFRQLALLEAMSYAWISYSVFAINLVLVTSRLTILLRTDSREAT